MEVVYQRKRQFFQNSHKMPQFMNKCVFLFTKYALIRHFCRRAVDINNGIKYN